MLALPDYGCLKNGVLHQAANKGDAKGLRRHLETNQNIDQPGKGGWTPLDVASYKGHAEIVRILLEAGAHVNARSLQLAQEYGYKEIAELLQAAMARQ
ncbi:MAG: ankyrin repeat domain-containing protein [Leptospirales bacterium]|nr:ankyrin repeat domain-containing protein [Leptospirales bacterium]